MTSTCYPGAVGRSLHQPAEHRWLEMMACQDLIESFGTSLARTGEESKHIILSFLYKGVPAIRRT